MEGILDFFKPSMISLIIDGLVLIFILFGFLWGAGRGLRKAGIRGINVVLTALVLMFILPFAFDAFFTTPVTIDMMGVTMQGETLNQYITNFLNTELPKMISGLDSSTVANTVLAVQGLIVTFLTAVIFPIMYIILNMLTWPIYAIVAACTKTKAEKDVIAERKKGNKNIKAKKYRWWGGLVGAAQAAFIAFIVLLPIGTLSNLITQANDTINSDLASEYISEDVKDYLNIYNDSITGKVFGVLDIDKNVFSLATTKTTKDDKGNEVKIKLISEAENIIAVTNIVLGDKYDFDFETLLNLNSEEDRVISGGDPEPFSTGTSTTEDVDTMDALLDTVDYLMSTAENGKPVIKNLLNDITEPAYNSSVLKAVLVDAVNFQLARLKADGYVSNAVSPLKVKNVKWDDDKDAVANNLADALVETYNLYVAAKDYIDLFEDVNIDNNEGISALADLVNSLVFDLTASVDWTKIGVSLDNIVDISLLKPILRPTVKQVVELLPTDSLGINVEAIGLEETKFTTIFGSVHSTLKVFNAVSKIFGGDYADLTKEELDSAIDTLADYLFNDTVSRNIMLETIRLAEDALEDQGLTTSTTIVNMTEAKWAQDEVNFASAMKTIMYQSAYIFSGFEDVLNPTFVDVQNMSTPERILALGGAFDKLYNLNIIVGLKDTLLDNFIDIAFEGYEEEAVKLIGTGEHNVLKLVKPSDFFKIAATLVEVAEAAEVVTDALINSSKDFESIKTYIDLLRDALIGDEGTIDVIFETEFFTKLMENFALGVAGDGIDTVPGLNITGYERPTSEWTTDMADSFKLMVGFYLDALEGVAGSLTTGLSTSENLEVWFEFMQGGQIQVVAQALDGILNNPLFAGFKSSLIDTYLIDVLNDYVADYMIVDNGLVTELKDFTFTELADIFENVFVAINPVMELIDGSLTADKFAEEYNNIVNAIASLPNSQFMKVVLTNVINNQLETGTVPVMTNDDWTKFTADFTEAMTMLLEIIESDLPEIVTTESLMNIILDKFAAIVENGINAGMVDEMLPFAEALDTLLGWNDAEGYVNPLETLIMNLIKEQLADLDLSDYNLDINEIDFGREGTTLTSLFETIKAGLEFVNLPDISSIENIEDLGEALSSIQNTLDVLQEQPELLENLKDTLLTQMPSEVSSAISGMISDIKGETEGMTDGQALAEILETVSDAVGQIFEGVTEEMDGGAADLSTALETVLTNMATSGDEGASELVDMLQKLLGLGA